MSFVLSVIHPPVAPATFGKAARYYDCGISLAPGDQDYATSSSDGYPRCAPPMDVAMFNPAAESGIASHTEDDRWDIDRRTVRFVGAWIDYINESKGI